MPPRSEKKKMKMKKMGMSVHPLTLPGHCARNTAR